MFWSANEPFFTSALIILLGYLLKKFGILGEDAGDTLAKTALNVTLPAVILLNVPTFPLREGFNAVLPVFALVGTALMIFVGYLALRRREREDLGLVLTSLSGYNLGLFAVPLVVGLYGMEGATRFLLIDLGNALGVFVVGYLLAALYSPRRGAKPIGPAAIIRMLAGSVPFVCYMAAIVMNLAGWRFDGYFGRVLEIPAGMNRGVSLLAIGVLLRFRLPEGARRSVLPSLAIRYLVGASAAAAALLLLPLPPEYRVSVAGVLIMPVGLAVIPFSVKWGYDRDKAAAILNFGIPISFVLFWAIWAVGRHLTV